MRHANGVGRLVMRPKPTLAHGKRNHPELFNPSVG